MLGTRRKKEKRSSSGTSKFDAEMAELEDDGQDEYEAVFDALSEDGGKSQQATKEAESKSMASESKKQKAEEDEVRKAREEEEQQMLASSLPEKDEEDEEAVEDYTDNDEDLADVFEHLEDGHESTLVDAQADPVQPEHGSIDLKKLKRDESDFAKEHMVPQPEKKVEGTRAEIHQARKAEKSRKAHKSRKFSRKKVEEEKADLTSALVANFEDGPAPTPGPSTLDSDFDGAVVASQPTTSSVADRPSEDGEESTFSPDLDPTMEAQKAALQAVFEGKAQQTQDVLQAQQVVSQQVPQTVSKLPLEQVALEVPPQVPLQASLPQQQQGQDASQPQVQQSQDQVPQSMQTAQLFSQQSDQAEADEADKPYDLSWLTDKGVDVTSEDQSSQLAPSQDAPNPGAESPPPSLPELPQQQAVPAPQQPSVTQNAILATDEAQKVTSSEGLPTALAAAGLKVVRIDQPDGLSVLVGGRNFTGAPAVTGASDLPSVTDLSLAQGSGFSVAFTIDWQEFSPGVHAIDIGDKDSDFLSVSSAEDGSALSFAMMHNGIPSVLTVSHAFEVGVSARFLCTVGSTGKMQAFRDGTILGRLKPDGTYQDNAPGGTTNPALASGQLFLGRSTEEQRKSAAKTFTGWLGDVCVFPKEVPWGEAASCVAKAVAASA